MLDDHLSFRMQDLAFRFNVTTHRFRRLIKQKSHVYVIIPCSGDKRPKGVPYTKTPPWFTLLFGRNK